MSNYDNASSFRGGGPKQLSDGSQHSISAPQHDIDRRIALLAFANLDRVRKHLAANGLMEGSKWNAVIVNRRIAVESNRYLARNVTGRISPRQRECLLKWLTDAEKEQVQQLVVTDTPECLKPENLPKKPPTRRNFDGND